MKKYLIEKLRDLYWEIYGKHLKNPKTPDSIKSILFICKGNICRSPFAEHRLRKLFAEKMVKNIDFYSAGLEVGNTVPPPEEAISAAEKFGVDLKEHKSKSMGNNIDESVSLIFTMTVKDFYFLRKRFPQLEEKIFLLPLFKSESNHSLGGFLRYNIADPYGKDLDSFIYCYQRINDCLKNFIDEIQQK